MNVKKHQEGILGADINARVETHSNDEGIGPFEDPSVNDNELRLINTCKQNNLKYGTHFSSIRKSIYLHIHGRGNF